MFIHRSIVEVSNKIFFIQCESNKSNRSNIIYVKINPKKKKNNIFSFEIFEKINFRNLLNIKKLVQF